MLCFNRYSHLLHCTIFRRMRHNLCVKDEVCEHRLFQEEVSVLSGQVPCVLLGVVSGAAVRDDHGSVVSVDPQAAGGAAGRHDDEDGDLQLHRVVSHGHGEVAVGGHDHALPLLLLQGYKALYDPDGDCADIYWNFTKTNWLKMSSQFETVCLQC